VGRMPYFGGDCIVSRPVQGFQYLFECFGGKFECFGREVECFGGEFDCFGGVLSGVEGGAAMGLYRSGIDLDRGGMGYAPELEVEGGGGLPFEASGGVLGGG